MYVYMCDDKNRYVDELKLDSGWLWIGHRQDGRLTDSIGVAARSLLLLLLLLLLLVSFPRPVPPRNVWYWLIALLSIRSLWWKRKGDFPRAALPFSPLLLALQTKVGFICFLKLLFRLRLLCHRSRRFGQNKTENNNSIIESFFIDFRIDGSISEIGLQAPVESWTDLSITWSVSHLLYLIPCDWLGLIGIVPKIPSSADLSDVIGPAWIEPLNSNCFFYYLFVLIDWMKQVPSAEGSEEDDVGGRSHQWPVGHHLRRPGRPLRVQRRGRRRRARVAHSRRRPQRHVLHVSFIFSSFNFKILQDSPGFSRILQDSPGLTLKLVQLRSGSFREILRDSWFFFVDSSENCGGWGGRGGIPLECRPFQSDSIHQSADKWLGGLAETQ